MAKGILYDDISLPKKVSDILLHDFFTMRHVGAGMVYTVTNPVKFSAFTSIFVHRGSGEADINLTPYSFRAPAIVNISADDIVYPRNISPDFEASFTVFSKLMVNDLGSILKDSGVIAGIHHNPIIELTEQQAERVENLYRDFEEIGSASDIKDPFQAVFFTCGAFMHRFGNLFYRQLLPKKALSVNNRITERFMQLAQEHFRRERFLDFYADKLAITSKHLSRTVKDQTGHSAADWLDRLVVLEAKVMLRSSNLTIQQISDELNFPSQSFFGKYFKKHTGQSPKEFRNQS